MVVMMSHHGRRTKETLLYLPLLVPSRSANRIPSTSLREAGVSNGAPQEGAEGMAGTESGLLHRTPDSRSKPARSAAGAAPFATPIEPTSVGHRAIPVRGRRC